jgi:hypothetical protein
MTAFRGWRRGRMHGESTTPSVPVAIGAAPDIGNAPAAETPPHIETELEKTANTMREIVKCAILDLGTFPSGKHFKNVVWYDTHKTFSYGGNSKIGEEPRKGKIYAVVTAPEVEESTGEKIGGEIEVRKAGGLPNEYGEYDLNSAQSHRATDQEVMNYAEPIMITIERRLEETRIKAIVDYRPLNNQKNSPDTNCLTTDLVNVDVAISQLSLLKVKYAVRDQQPAQ